MTELSDYRRLVESPMILGYEDRLKRAALSITAEKQKMDGLQYALETLLAAMDEGMTKADIRKSLKCIIEDSRATEQNASEKS